MKSKIEWNKVTWYSRLISLVVFLLVLPLLTFYIGIQYEKTDSESREIPEQNSYIPHNLNTRVKVSRVLSDSDIMRGVIKVFEQEDKIKVVEEKGNLSFIDESGKKFGGWNQIKLARGDIDTDGVEDALIVGTWCAASCGTTFTIALANNEVFNVKPDGIETSGWMQYAIQKVEIKNGLIYVTADTHKKGEERKVFEYRLEQNYTLKLVAVI